MKFKTLFLSLFIVTLLSSCAAVKSPVTGFVYTDAKAPFAVTSNSGSSKVGTATATSILGWIGMGDASIQAAAKSAGITKIHHVDEQVKNYLGFYAKYTVVVYGE
ncbi:MAG: TRL-like family protein [Chitinophagales bacterium]|nr:TRL-like family protein [Chitinophagales bacterium]